jgi:teichuronic acid biosynthesis glycosyltransferase TuaG
MEVTILIPLFNGVEFLKECLESVKVQEFQKWEVLIGINGHGFAGGDVALQVLDILAQLDGDPRIRILIQPPPLQGKVQSLNALLEEVQTPWCAILDCDDKWHPQKLQIQMEALQQDALAQGADIVGTQCVYFGHHYGSPQIPIGWIQSHHLVNVNPIINSSALIRTQVCKKLKWRYTDLCYGMEDYDFWMRAEREGYRMYNLSAPLVFHRIHPASVFNTKSQNPEALQNAYRAILNGVTNPAQPWPSQGL